MQFVKKPKKVLFLYSELAGYFLACIDKLVCTDDIDVHIIHWSVNKEAPFNFLFPERLNVYDKKKYSSDSLLVLVKKINPDLIYCSGWIDKDYISLCKSFDRKIPVILGLDNQWKGTIKQYLASIVSSFTLQKYFSYCWVPGELQKEYALKLGFKKDKILTGFYSADFDFFNKLYLQNLESKKKNFPKRFIYVGRYYSFKGITDLWNAFIELQEESSNDWELWCLGSGDINPVVHDKIKHFGFVQPVDMPYYIANTGVFILPSYFEPWGVVVHEFAAAGFPILCSSEVGAASTFVENNVNGYIFKSENKKELKSWLKKIMSHSDEQLIEMGNVSTTKASGITPEKWVDTLLSVL